MSSKRTQRRHLKRKIDLILAEIEDQSDENVSDLLSDSVRNRDNNQPPNCDLSTFNINSDSFSLSDNSNSVVQAVGLDVQLARWAVDHNIKQNAMDGLLAILKPHINSVELPKTSRTLLKTPTRYVISEISGGEYHYFGLMRYIVSLKPEDFKDKLIRQDCIAITLSADGVPISKSSRRQFWPLLITFDDTKDRRPCLIALYFGKTKPGCVKEFLKPFIDECMEINRLGVNLLGKRIRIFIRCVVADAPARAFLKCVVPYNHYDGCERCCDKGKYKGRVIFTRTDAERRTDAGFKNQINSNHHCGTSPLLDLNVGLVSSVVLDYMHLVCLGVTRKLMNCWFKGPSIYKVAPRVTSLVSDRLIELRKYVPSEFNRKPRSLSELDTWKATEFRTFLLYLGPFVLKKVLDDKKYEHFLKLSTAIRILLSNNSEWYPFANDLLVSFVEETSCLYSSEFLVYNVHSLVHLTDDAVKYGSLDSISAFKFENYMQTLKSMVRSHCNELSQVVRRVYEKEILRDSLDCQVSHFTIRNLNKPGDNCFMLTGGRIVRIARIESDFVYFNRFRMKSDVDWVIIESSRLCIFKVSCLKNSEEQCTIGEIVKKVMLLPFSIVNSLEEKTFLALPLCE